MHVHIKTDLGYYNYEENTFEEEKSYKTRVLDEQANDRIEFAKVLKPEAQSWEIEE